MFCQNDGILGQARQLDKNQDFLYNKLYFCVQMHDNKN